MIDASRQWPVQGTPENPAGWLIHVASRRMVDRIRSASPRRDREEAAAASEPPPPASAAQDADDTLVLMFMCCHPALSDASATALTLRAVGGLKTAEIAAGFLVPESTMAQRISRAKRTIEDSPEPFRMPAGEERSSRLRSVLRVLYLIFNEGYLASQGAGPARGELSGEAIRLARVVRLAAPDHPEAAGLLALMLLTDARREARFDEEGAIVPLDEQDRSRWDRGQIDEGLELLGEAVKAGAVGEYQLQAAVAAVHSRAASTADTDWSEIAGLYALLEQITGNPMVTLNRAIAVAMSEGPQAGLEMLAPLEERLGDHHRLHSTRGHLLEMAGDAAGANREYSTAAARTNSASERDHLLMRAARVRQSG